jgi:hypothetical protein
VRVAVRNRGLATAAVATIDLLTRSGRRLATQPVAELAAGEIGVIRFEAPLDGPAEPLRVWVRPGSFDADPTNDLADVPHPIPLSGRLVFRTWPQRQLLTRGDAVGAGQAILVEAAGAGRLSVRVDGLLTEADTTWLEAAGERAVIRLQPGRRKVEARLSGVEATGSVITLDVVHRLTVRNALILPNPVGRDGAHFTCYLSRAARLTIDIYGLSGRRVRRLGPEPAATGFVSLSWDGRDESGGALAAGTYLYVVSARGDGETSSRRGILVMAP